MRKSGGFTYKSGRLAPEGQYHCHRGLVGKPIILDGLEVLGERGDQDREEDGGEVDREPSAQSQDRQEHAPAEGWLRLY